MMEEAYYLAGHLCAGTGSVCLIEEVFKLQFQGACQVVRSRAESGSGVGVTFGRAYSMCELQIRLVPSV